MSQVIIPDTVAELLSIWEMGTAEERHFLTDTSPEKNGVFQMLQATNSGLVVVGQVPIVGVRFPQHQTDPPVTHVCRFDITKPCRDDIYRVYGPGYWKKGVYIESDDGHIGNYLPNDVVKFTLTLQING